MLLETAPQRKQLISLTPLIDVVFILLLFFMLSSTFIREKQIEMETSSLGGSESQQHAVHLLIRQDGEVLVDGIQYEVNSNTFSQRLDQIRIDGASVTIAATPKTPVQNLIMLIDQVRNSGISNLNLSETQKP